MHSGSDWWRWINVLFGQNHGCRRRSRSVWFSLERSSSRESLRGELLPNVWRCPSGWSVLGGCVDPRCELEEVLMVSYQPQPRQCNWSERSSSERSSGTSTITTCDVFYIAERSSSERGSGTSTSTTGDVGAVLSRSAWVGFGCGSSISVGYGVFSRSE